MTMHLLRGVTSNSTRKPTFKLTKKKQAEWQLDWQNDNKRRKQQGLNKISFEEYCDNRLGKVKTVSKSTQSFKPLVANFRATVSSTANIPSLNANVGNTYKKESPKYDGERKLLGIAVLHKSCLQPVFSQKDAEEIARMRRG